MSTCRHTLQWEEYWCSLNHDINTLFTHVNVMQHCNNEPSLKSSSSSVTENLILTLAQLARKYICSDNTDVRGDPQDPSLSPQASREGLGEVAKIIWARPVREGVTVHCGCPAALAPADRPQESESP